MDGEPDGVGKPVADGLRFGQDVSCHHAMFTLCSISAIPPGDVRWQIDNSVIARASAIEQTYPPLRWAVSSWRDGTRRHPL